MNQVEEQLTELVDAGCTHLDHDLPNWAEMIDTPILDMQSCQRCVVGQIKAYCSRNLRGQNWPEYIRDPSYEEALGFDLPVHLYFIENAWATLARLWLDAIRERTT